MNSPPFTTVPLVVFGEKIHFDDFEISWVAENPLTGNLCFGSYEGRFRTLNKVGPSDPASPSGEAVNGIAFSSRAMAVSTRSDVAFIVFDDDGLGHRAVYDGGAHGVIATSSGGFVAPLGRNGVLTMKPIPGLEQILATARVDGERTNFYKFAHCAGNGKTDLIVGASRGDGLAVMELDSLGDRINLGHTHFLRRSGLDVVDVCSLNSPEWPHAVAWLGIDCSIHLSRDILEDRPSKTFRINELRGKAYSILCDRGNLFLLTSDAVYVIPDVATKYLSGTLEGGSIQILACYTKTIDEIYIVCDKVLFSINNDIYCTPAESIVPELERTGWASSLGWNPEIAEIPWEKTSEREWLSKPNNIDAA